MSFSSPSSDTRNLCCTSHLDLNCKEPNDSDKLVAASHWRESVAVMKSPIMDKAVGRMLNHFGTFVARRIWK